MANLGSLSNLPPAKHEVNKHICIVSGDLTSVAAEAYVIPFGDVGAKSMCQLTAKVHA